MGFLGFSTGFLLGFYYGFLLFGFYWGLIYYGTLDTSCMSALSCYDTTVRNEMLKIFLVYCFGRINLVRAIFSRY